MKKYIILLMLIFPYVVNACGGTSNSFFASFSIGNLIMAGLGIIPTLIVFGIFYGIFKFIPIEKKTKNVVHIIVFSMLFLFFASEMSHLGSLTACI